MRRRSGTPSNIFISHFDSNLGLKDTAMSTKGIVVKGLVIHCRAGWTVEKALHEMRKRHGLQHGGIEEDGVAVSGDEVIGDLAGTLVFVGGEPVQQIGKHHCFPVAFLLSSIFIILFQFPICLFPCYSHFLIMLNCFQLL